MNPFASYCPLLLDADMLYLSGSLTIQGRRVYDTTVGALHCIQPAGTTILAALGNGPIAFAALRHASKNAGVDDTQLSDLLGFLNVTGGLIRRRPVRAHANACKQTVRNLLLGTRYKPLYVRRRATPLSITKHIIGASWPIITLSILTAGLAAAGGVLPAHECLFICGAWLSIFISSTFLHELSHYLLLRHNHIPTDVIKHGFRCGLLHRQQLPDFEIKTALLGPAAGSVWCILCAAVSFGLHQPSAIAICGIVLLIQALSLVPWYGDGMSLQAARRQKRYDQ
ncbi:MAG TPA: hypothetical protein VFT16_05185 [Candidatus Saccharimonadales bacterium]|nr:hypothetical protein [Candidatus Saccharimonadales bacterium]